MNTAYGWTPATRVPRVRERAYTATLDREPPSVRGLVGTRCPLCQAQLTFGTLDGVAVEWCPTHGCTVTPREMRASRLHDQRETLLAELAREVVRETGPLRQWGQRGTMRPLAVGREAW